jgi:glutathione S-transferase
VESLLITFERELVSAGYTLLMNQDRALTPALRERLLASFRQIDGFLREHSPDGTFLFEEFSHAEAVFAPMFMRFWFLDYYEGFTLPPALARVQRWRDACLAHPAAQQTSKEEIIKVYYDYAKGVGNGGLVPGRTRSSFAFEPHWATRPYPPADKYGGSATDVELGLI